MTLKIGSRSPKSNQVFYLLQILKYTKLGLNPLKCSRDKCRQDLAGKIWIPMIPKNMKKAPKSSKPNHF